MKKLFTMFAVVVLTTTMALAQDLTSKKGENYLPEGDEWSIGFDGTSLLNYFGNFIGSADTVVAAPTVQSPNFTGNGATFYGKKIIDENTAWRARVEFGFGSSSVSTPNIFSYEHLTYDVTEEEEDPGDPDFVAGEVDIDSEDRTASAVDKVTHSGSGYSLWLGKEFRRGTTRLQGVYGAEVGIGLGSSKVTTEYGHQQSLVVQGGGDLSRVTEEKDGSTFSLGARVFIGAEYFILPKISLAAEYGWGLGLTSVGKSSITTETTEVIDGPESDWDHTPNQQIGPDTYKTTSSTSDGESGGSFGIGNDLRGSISVNLYF